MKGTGPALHDSKGSSMATARDYFTQSQHMQFGTIVTVTGDSVPYEASVEVIYDFEGGSKYLKVYLPETTIPDRMLAGILANASELIWKPENEVSVTQGFAGTSERVTTAELRFSGRVLVYTPSIIDQARWNTLAEEIASSGLSLLVRDGTYAKVRSENEAPLAFISHDSRDKEGFVAALASELTMSLCPVWYDEYRLKPGDNLREKIESGLKTCPRCIIVLSKNFISNPGWTKKEFDSVFMREILKGENVIIPIWLDVTKEEVYEYCPPLMNTVAVDASLGAKAVAARLVGVLKANPPIR
ncbi:toll/interleukin-1 receptor domain-containing protein [Phenylobacterium sp.]|uniref:toll/interleukin-1 receptor domain-containing protein n=1 Tax=Phenylobacterium sp. TaxID=1871053 RepID=UPI0025D20C66|nr:toll/interleukin-1 receptor domain-containing protein [Phenylobacterium sp.]MCA3739393.1 toll/interleukin-1 receptor domain-containing protein [Phenylobacterium sp.]